MPGFWCSAQHFGNILAISKPVVGDFYEHFSNQGFFDSLVVSHRAGVIVKTKIISAQEVRTHGVRTVEISTLPIGKYKGVWGGYEVTAEIEGVKYQFKTEKGIRTQSTPCVVTIQDGIATIEAG